MSNNTREPGIIKYAEVRDTDHGCMTVDVLIEFTGGGAQGFGGLALQSIEYEGGATSLGNSDLIDDYKKCLCQAFHVYRLAELKGKKCFALRSMNGWNESIDGLEAEDGKRFTNYSWRKKHFPDTTKHPLAEKIDSIKADIARHARRSAELEQELKNVTAKFVDWG
jgi:hypothetical protein